jgi:hypothetical protein
MIGMQYKTIIGGKTNDRGIRIIQNQYGVTKEGIGPGLIDQTYGTCIIIIGKINALTIYRIIGIELEILFIKKSGSIVNNVFH